MQTMSTVKKSIITAVCIALCYVLPLLFHGIQGAGQIFCPMHIPVFLCGLVCGWQFGLLCGLAGRVVNGLVNALIFARGSYSMATWVAGSVVKSWPGTVIQLVFIPSIVFALMKARLIPERYPKEVPADD